MQGSGSNVREFDGDGTGASDLDLTESMTARVTLKLLRPGCRRRQPTEQPRDQEYGEVSHGYNLHKELALEANSEVHLAYSLEHSLVPLWEGTRFRGARLGGLCYAARKLQTVESLRS